MRKRDNLADLYITFVCKAKYENEKIVYQQNEIQDARWFPLNELDNVDIADFTKTMINKALNCKIMLLDKETDELNKSRKYLKEFEQFWAPC